jgi:hypothetical protein
VERSEAEVVYAEGRDAVVRVLLELSAQNERLAVQVDKLGAHVARQDERIAQLERRWPLVQLATVLAVTYA